MFGSIRTYTIIDLEVVILFERISSSNGKRKFNDANKISDKLKFFFFYLKIKAVYGKAISRVAS
jgi:hypothetical protein